MAATSRDNGRVNFYRNLEFGKLVEAIVSNNLQGRAYWGVEDRSTYEPDRHMTTICQAQKWVYVGDNKDAWDYEVNCNSCSACKYRDKCTDKPYLNEVIKQKHEIKGNKRTHMITLNEMGFEQYRTQNIFIELKQRLDDGRYINGWWHESKRKERAAWYHFFQPVEYTEKGVPYGNPDRASEDTIRAFIEDDTISENDTLITVAPWGYILSIRMVDLERIIDELKPEYTKYKIGKIIPVDILLNRYRGKGVNYTPVFTEIDKTGKEVKGTSGKRWIPEELRDKFVQNYALQTNTDKLNISENGANDLIDMLRPLQGKGIDFGGEVIAIIAKHTIPKEHTKEKEEYKIETRQKEPDPKPHYIEAFFGDFDQMGIFHGGDRPNVLFNHLSS